MQPVCAHTPDIEITQRADYFEIYAADVRNTDATIQSAIAAIHDPQHCPNFRRRSVRH